MFFYNYKKSAYAKVGRFKERRQGKIGKNKCIIGGF